MRYGSDKLSIEAWAKLAYLLPYRGSTHPIHYLIIYQIEQFDKSHREESHVP